MTAPLVTPRNPANTGAATVTAFPFAKARMRYKQDRRPTIPELLKDKFLLDLLALAEARFHANPGGVTYANLAMPDANVLTALGARFDDHLSKDGLCNQSHSPLSPSPGNHSSSVSSSTKLRSQPGHVSSAPSSSGPVGLQPDHVYRSQLSPWRFKIRSALLVTLNKEMTILESIQRSYRSGPLDRLMVHSSWLGSHQFFILALPLIFWLGDHHFERSPVYILGINCASKYGFPSSHSAISASTFLMGLQYTLHVQLIVQQLTLFLGLILYGFLLVFGRVYCEMHLIQDVACGWTIDDCPCFEDSTAFVAVSVGVMNFAMLVTLYLPELNDDDFSLCQRIQISLNNHPIAIFDLADDLYHDWTS
ncbi:hypothetical protein PtA15_17A82 [Puccinia triticina]|uniref:Phosphatidic acid phosphatase type 2/haloperoxidase domain-containing protein n=1 Tax=Puccinia triticina TaxID=208348 RepID=A0ABY7D4Q9_9BASI|nr:uncharacterized protein PtA15_17A82 [Puccinia triticina]WAQ92601.1 hypothetical protein PtA15_17A82 [Puccinia triticina]